MARSNLILIEVLTSPTASNFMKAVKSFSIRLIGWTECFLSDPSHGDSGIELAVKYVIIDDLTSSSVLIIRRFLLDHCIIVPVVFRIILYLIAILLCEFTFVNQLSGIPRCPRMPHR